MDFRSQVREVMNRADSVRVAAAPPPSKEGFGSDHAPPDGGTVARKIPKDHKYDPKSLKPLAKMLWAMSVALGHTLQAYRLFNRVKSSTVSPDGMLGGRGYVMKVQDLRQRIFEAVEALSAASDTVHDELNAPHWKPKIGELSKEDIAKIERLMGESEEMIDNSEEIVDEEEEEVEKSGKSDSSWVRDKNPKTKKPSSDLPSGGHSEPAIPKKRPSSEESQGSRPKMASVMRSLIANSSVNPDTLPGPRIKHLDRADTDQNGSMGSVNPDEPVPPKDEWGKEDGVSGEPMSQDRGNHPLYERSVSSQESVSESTMPGAITDTTPTKGFDFGLGRGNGNDAHGQGIDGPSQTYSPSMGDKGSYGPHADLPNDPGGKTQDRSHSDTTPAIEESLNNVFKTARNRIRQLRGMFVGPADPGPSSGLPIETPQVARSDYYTGPKDNDIDTVRGPTENPVTSEAELPGDVGAANDTFDKGLLDTGYTYERVDEPYVKWDDTTPNMRPDWVNQRKNQGPYAKPGN